jgi:PAS domain S-box-containing protein
MAATRRHWNSAEGIVMGVNAAMIALVTLRQLLARREIRRLADARRIQEAHFRSLVQHASDIMTVVDGDGTIRLHSPAVTRVLGYDAEAWTGIALASLVHPDDAVAAAALLGRAGETPGTPVVATIRLRHRLGAWVALETVATDLLGDPAVRGVVLNGRDVGERQQLEDALRQAQKMEAVGRLAGGVAHDFNNLLAGIRGNAGLIRAACDADDQRHADAGEIEIAVDRAAALTRQLLAFSRRQIVAPSVVDVNAVVTMTERLLRRLLPPRLEYVATLHEPLWPVHADAAQLGQVVMNLVLNARDAIAGDGRIAVRTANEAVDAASARRIPGLVPGDYVVLSVSDTGCGMDAHVRERIFEPFFTTKSDGSGLGLPTVHGIVSQAGGHVAVESAPGQGTRFVVYLPRLVALPGTSGGAPPPNPDAVVRDAAPSGGRETVLVVDDEESVRTTIRRILLRQGYTVLTAEHGAEALALAGSHDGDVHLLLTDLSMPVMGGRELMDEFRSRWPGVPVVCMSGYSQDAALREELSSRADRFLGKPFSVDGLVRIVRAALDGVAAAR